MGLSRMMSTGSRVVVDDVAAVENLLAGSSGR